MGRRLPQAALPQAALPQAAAAATSTQSAPTTFELLGEAGNVLGDHVADARFLSPGAPRAAWLDIEVTLP